MDTIKILLTGAGAPGAAGIIRCIRQDPDFHIIAADADPNASGKWLSDDFEVIPKGNAPDFIEQIEKIVEAHGVHIILPLVTRELLPLSFAAPGFHAKNVQVMVSDTKALETANDKGKLYQHLYQAGIPVPEFQIIQEYPEFLPALNKLGFPDRKLCFKPVVSNGSRGFRIIEENTDESDLLFNHKPMHVFISSGKAMEILQSAHFPELMISEYLPGDEYSVDCVVHPGIEPLIIPRKRVQIRQGISTAGVFEQDHSIISYCRKILDSLPGLSGNIGIQVKRNNAGEPRLLEINPRVQGTIVAGLGAGVNLPLYALYLRLGKAIPDSMLNIVWNTHFVRVWKEIFWKENT